MATTFLVAPLTVLCTVGFQNSSGRNIVGSRNIAASETNLKNETYKSNRNFRTKLRNLSKKDKLILRRVKNTEAAKASREKAKLHQKFLEERLSDLQYEKMKLLLEKEALSKQHMELQKENLDLKSKVQNMNSLHMKEENSCEATIRHAERVGGFQDFHHSIRNNMESNKSKLCQSISNSIQRSEKHTQSHQISDTTSMSCMDTDDPINRFLTQFSLIEWVNNPESDNIGDQIFSSLESNNLSHENDKNIEDLNKSSIEEQILTKELEYPKDFDEFFESQVKEDLKERRQGVMEVRKYQSISTGNSCSTNFSNAAINQTFIELPPQWTFDNLFEEIN